MGQTVFASIPKGCAFGRNMFEGNVKEICHMVAILSSSSSPQLRTSLTRCQRALLTRQSTLIAHLTSTTPHPTPFHYPSIRRFFYVSRDTIDPPSFFVRAHLKRTKDHGRLVCYRVRSSLVRSRQDLTPAMAPLVNSFFPVAPSQTSCRSLGWSPCQLPRCRLLVSPL